MTTTTLKDLVPLVKSFEWMGFDLMASKHGKFFKYPERFFIPLTGASFWFMAMMYYIYMNLNDVDNAVQSIMPIVQMLLTLAKCILYVYKQRNIRELVARVDELAVKNTTGESERETWNAAMKTVNTIAFIYRLLAHITLVVCFAAPHVMLLISYMRTGEAVVMLPLPAIFPFDYTRPFYFLLTNVWFLQLGILSVQVLVGVDSLFGWFIFSISGHLHILRLKLMQALDACHSPNCTPQQFHSKFSEMVVYHQRIIAVKNEFDAVFAVIVFAEILFSCLLMCFIMFEFAFSRDLANLLFVFVFMLLCVTQLLIYCLGGEKIKNESESICKSIYLLTPWHDLPPRLQRLFLFSLLRSQHTLSVSGYFFIADHTLLLWVFKSAGSVSALLFAMKEEEQ